MTILDEITQYAHNCIEGRVISCQKHIWACRRLLRDVERAGTPEFPYHWEEDRAQNIIDWFAELRHSKGVLAGQPIILTDWQKFCICQIYGWRKEDGTRRFTQSFIEVARKNAKSQMEAGIALYEISAGASENGEIYEAYTAGTKHDQSAIILNEARNMLSGSRLKAAFRVKQYEIVHIKTGSFLRALSKDDGKKGDGTNPAFLCLDEYHQHATTEFYDLGLGAQSKEPLLMIITTAGMDLSYPCYTQEYDLCSQILNPDMERENEQYFVDILEADEGDDPGSLDTWKKANPIRAYYPEGVQKIRDAWVIAQAVPEKMVAFKTKMLNIWVQAAENGYMDMAKWRACEAKAMPDLSGCPVYVGFDMSAKIDLTSVAFIVPVKDGETVKYYLWCHSFVPNREKLLERQNVDKMPYLAWADMGYITVTDTPIVDQSAVIAYVLDFCGKMGWEIERLCFDPAGASKMMMDLSNEGYTVEEVYQSQRSLHEATSGFREQVYSGNVIFLLNPVLSYAMGNAVIRSNQGLIKIDKDKTNKRIDPVDATLCAFKLAMYHDFYDVNAAMEKWLDEDW